jgi:23S rRNA (cytidine1920-2'-O)/16S rRNA (cytidine1409-2'-O)-methyltransferase
MAASRTQAERMVTDGLVQVRGVPTPKPATLVAPDTPITLQDLSPRRVGRGGVKLEGALDAFAVDVKVKRALDAGASTGGFTEVLLERGAESVVALDVGHGQLDQSLRRDPRVTVMERTNLRHVTLDEVGGPFPLIVADLSFISLCTVAARLAALSLPGADLILLIKPQFEAGRGEVGRGGIVRDPDVRRRAVEKVLACLDEAGLGPRALEPSPIAGIGGNREVFVWCRAGEPAKSLEVPA